MSVKASEDEAVVVYGEPLATRDLQSSGFRSIGVGKIGALGEWMVTKPPAAVPGGMAKSFIRQPIPLQLQLHSSQAAVFRILT